MNDKLTEIEMRCSKATQGKWIVKPPDDDDTIVITSGGEYILQLGYDRLSSTITKNRFNDAEFIANAKDDISYLLWIIKNTSV